MRRNNIDIMLDILEKTNIEKVTKTKIVYSANLNFKRADKYLDLLCTMQLVEYSSQTYSITELGREYLKKFKEFNSIFRDKGIELLPLK